ncbi:hypothetical protein LXL04_014170 [Taraxacum kok-saghyz]
MFEFGDELIIDSYRIPWLIWIQLVAMFLLVILVFYLTTTPPDLSLDFSTTTTASASASQSATALSRSFLTSAAANTYQNLKVRENEINETGTSTSEVVQRRKSPNVGRNQMLEGTSANTTTGDEGNGIMLEHPCHLFGVAKQAFLKCLGLGMDSEPDNSRHKEKDE